MAKTKKFIVSLDFLTRLTSGVFEVIAHPLPDDLIILSACLSEKRVTIIVSSETFSESDKSEFAQSPIIRRVETAG